jgi:hypothetical protein
VTLLEWLNEQADHALAESQRCDNHGEPHNAELWRARLGVLHSVICEITRRDIDERRAKNTG